MTVSVILSVADEYSSTAVSIDRQRCVSSGASRPPAKRRYRGTDPRSGYLAPAVVPAARGRPSGAPPQRQRRRVPYRARTRDSSRAQRIELQHFEVDVLKLWERGGDLMLEAIHLRIITS